MVAAIRLYYMYRSTTLQDPMWDSLVIILLGFTELNMSVAIPCLITLKPLLDKVVPGLLAQKQSSQRLNQDGSPVDRSESVFPPTISSPQPRQVQRDMEMQDLC